MMEKLDHEAFRIRIHHVGGIGDFGPASVLDKLGHVEWTVYDAQASSLASVVAPSSRVKLVNKCLGETDNKTIGFHILESPTASSIFKPARAAKNYTLKLPDGRILVWGEHAKLATSTQMETRSLDSLVGDEVVSDVDFLSIDAQGAELSILKGTSKSLGNTVLGVLCEVEFAELYESQPLFSDIQALLGGYDFRLCELFDPQYFNALPSAREVLGKGFLTVAEALFLKNPTFPAEGIALNERGSRSFDPVALLKLAAIAVVFDQVDFALMLCRYVASKGVFLSTLATRTGVRYLGMLSELTQVAEMVESDKGLPQREVSEKEVPVGRRYPSPLQSVIRMLAVFATVKLRKTIGYGKATNKSGISTSIAAVLSKYGLEELAVKHQFRSRHVPYLTDGYHTAILERVSRLAS